MSLFLAIPLSLALAALAAEDPPLPRQAPEGTRAVWDAAYVVDGHPRQKLDLFIPPGDGPRPLVIWIHGGAFRAGDKRDGNPALALLRRGFAVASLGYRFSQDAIFPAPVEDCKAAVRWLRKHAKEYGIDPERFGAWGSSAGGYFVAMLGTTGGTKLLDIGADLDVSSQVSCVVNFFGPTDFTRMTEQSKAVPRSMEHDSPRSPESQFLGGPVQQEKAKAAKANPITYVSKETPPFLVVHGDQDPLVPYGQSVLLVDTLKTAGVPVELRTVKGGGHGVGFGRAEHAAAEAFLTRHLRP